MKTARVLCGVTLRVEVWDEDESLAARLASESKLVSQAIKAYDAVSALFASEGGASTGSAPVSLDTGGAKFGEETKTSRKPSFVVPDVVPLKWHLKRNSFRVADEFECTIPAAILPVPPQSIRSISCEVVVAHIDDDTWSERMAAGIAAIPLLEFYPESFVGVAHDIKTSASNDGTPTISLSFRDYVGLLVSMKVKIGTELDEEQPISKAVEAFLKGTPAEGLECVWVDPKYDEPTFGKHKPKITKRKGKNASKPVQPKESYLHAITEACANVGCVGRVVVNRLEFAFAGTMYEGRDRGGDPKATILVGQIVESLEISHALLGDKIQSVQVVSFDPDTHRQHIARWPPDPKNVKGATIDKGGIPRLPPLLANVGLPGYDQLDESVKLIPVAPVRDPSLLPQVAQAYFLERNRQRVKMTIKTHSPWSDPAVAGRADLLELQAGDNIRFGFVEYTDDELIPPALRAISGDIGASGVQALLEQVGVEKIVAGKIAAAVSLVPSTDLMRVDEVDISGGDDGAEISITLVTFTVIESDLQALAQGESPADLKRKANLDPAFAKSLTAAQLKAHYAELRAKLDASSGEDDEKADTAKAIDAAERAAMKGR